LKVKSENYRKCTNSWSPSVSLEDLSTFDLGFKTTLDRRGSLKELPKPNKIRTRDNSRMKAKELPTISWKYTKTGEDTSSIAPRIDYMKFNEKYISKRVNAHNTLFKISKLWKIATNIV
jgi:hypothetical protein